MTACGDCFVWHPCAQRDSLLLLGPLLGCGKFLLCAWSTSCPPSALTWMVAVLFLSTFSHSFLSAAVAKQMFPFLNLLSERGNQYGSALANGIFLLEPLQPYQLPKPVHVNTMQCSTWAMPLKSHCTNSPKHICPVPLWHDKIGISIGLSGPCGSWQTICKSLIFLDWKEKMWIVQDVQVALNETSRNAHLWSI